MHPPIPTRWERCRAMSASDPKRTLVRLKPSLPSGDGVGYYFVHVDRKTRSCSVPEMDRCDRAVGRRLWPSCHRCARLPWNRFIVSDHRDEWSKGGHAGVLPGSAKEDASRRERLRITLPVRRTA